MTAKRLPIAKIRQELDFLAFQLRDFTGGTVSENAALDLPAALKPQIDKVKQLYIPARFTKDCDRREQLLSSAESAIRRWENYQLEPGQVGYIRRHDGEGFASVIVLSRTRTTMTIQAEHNYYGTARPRVVPYGTVFRSTFLTNQDPNA